MNICGFSPIPILITFLCCGILFVYFNLRMTEIRQAVEKQNKVLTAFITNIQQDIRGGGMATSFMGNSSNIPVSDSLASPIALQTAQRIEVSDDDTDDDDDDSDTENDTDSDCECSDEEQDKIIEKPIKPIQLNDITLEGVSVLAFEVVDNNNVSQHNTNSSSITEITEDIVDLGGENNSTPNYETMKVDDLRTAVVSNSLATKDDAKKLKKPELLTLLKK
jgi:hypothetical protein